MFLQSISGPPYHHICTLEAQEPNQGQPFPETFIGRFPLEIRQMIYYWVLNTPAPNNRIPQSMQSLVFTDHRCERRLWSPARQARSKNTNAGATSALQASYPPFAAPYPTSKAALLLTCWQIYLEARELYEMGEDWSKQFAHDPKDYWGCWHGLVYGVDFFN